MEKTPLLRDKNIFVLDDDENRIARLYNVLGVKGITVPSDLTDKRFNIYAIYGTHPTGSEIIEELYILRSPEETDWTPSGIELNEETTPNDQNVYDLQGRKILSTKLPKGIYIVGGRKVVVK